MAPIGGKADMAFCTANVCFSTEADMAIRPLPEFRLMIDTMPCP